ncbi:DHS-like NAD/FAD-binding domain-containing protein [Peziza echinospora]|nr:DHS-like NAD/FAD-binding domain-containing protein [Peziza echinospora]
MAVPRIPYTSPFPPAIIRPSTASTLPAALSALRTFLWGYGETSSHNKRKGTLILTGAGISVGSGLADYRGENGTYRLNKAYRPIYFTEFVGRHESRKRYWARSFLGWPTMEKARPNKSHLAIAKLGNMGLIDGIITQNVDSLHHMAHPQLNIPPNLPTPSSIFDHISLTPPETLHPEVVELHGTLRHVKCLTCSSQYPRHEFQKKLIALNPSWADLLFSLQESEKSGPKTIRTNPDGDVDLPGVAYKEFRYPPCPKCFAEGGVEVDKDGAHIPYPPGIEGDQRIGSSPRVKGILKPSVVFFGEAVHEGPREAANRLVQSCGRILVVGSSLATYSAWRLVKEAVKDGKGFGIINIGGVRGELELIEHGEATGLKSTINMLRLEFPAAELLGGVVEMVEGRKIDWGEEVGVGGVEPTEHSGLGTD